MTLARLQALRERPGDVTPAALTPELTSALDNALVELAEGVELGGVALVATGGYGAGRLCLHSDVDIMMLQRGSFSPSDARAILDPLWSAGLRVGHAVRTPSEAVDVAKGDLATVSSLLTMRRIAGDREVFADLERRLERLVARRAKRLRAAWTQEEGHRRRAEPYREMAADVKNGRGGWRSLQTIAWDRRTTEILSRDPTERADEEQWWETLTQVRNALHASAGRTHDRFDFELRAPAADWLGLSAKDLGTLLLETTRRIETTVTELFGTGLEAPGPPTRHVRIPVAENAVIGQAVHAAMTGRALKASEAATAGEAPPPRWASADVRALAYLLEPGWTRIVFRQLAGSGWLERAMPEWLALQDVPHLVPFHSHPVADHVLRTGDELISLLDEEGHPFVAVSAGDRLVLQLAAWLHDVGKGEDGDHSIVGALIAGRIADRLGLSADESAMLVTLVEHHLLLPDLATQHDLADPSVIAEAIDAVGTPRTLDLLYLLSVADSRATGPGGWSPWKADLLQRAHRTVRAAFARRAVEAPAQEDLISAVVDRGIAERDARSHLELIAHRDRQNLSPDQVADDITIATPQPRQGEVRFRYSLSDATTHLTVCTIDTHGLLATTAGVLALHNASVLDALLLTRTDNVVVDHFELVDALSGKPIVDGRLEAAQRDLTAAIAGELDVAAAVAEKQRAYRSRVQMGITPSVTVRARPVGCMVEVQGADRMGLLYDLARVIGSHELGIRRARIDTRGSSAVDAFHTRQMPKEPERLRADLLAVFER